jgi:outer membrane protein assembly factor BamB
MAEVLPPSRSPRTRRGLAIGFAALALAALATASCTNDIIPNGGWSGPAAGEGYLYLGSGGADGHIIRIDATSGQMDAGWKYPSGKAGVGAIYGTPLVEDGVIYGAGYSCRGNICNAEVVAVEASTGSPVWAEGGYNISTKIIGRLALGSASLVFGTTKTGAKDDSPGYLYALDPSQDSGRPLQDRVVSRLKWRLPVDGEVIGGPAVVDDVAYFGTMGRTFYAVDLKDNPRYLDDVKARVLWTFKARGAITALPLLSGGRVYFGDFQNQFYALNAEARRRGFTGPVSPAEGEWQFESKTWFWAQPVTEGGVIYAATLGGEVYALDGRTGKPAWSEPAQISGQAVARPEFVETQRGRALAVSSTRKDVVLVKLSDGSVQGSLFTNGPVKSPVAVLGDFVFVHALNGEFYTFSAKSLERRFCVLTRGKEAGARCQS